MAEIPVSDQKARKPGQANAMQPAEELVCPRYWALGYSLRGVIGMRGF
jgi:hypothetical protein